MKARPRPSSRSSSARTRRPAGSAAGASDAGAVDAAEPGSATLKSLAKGLRALEMLLRKDSVGVTDVAHALDIDKGAASRILRTLADCGFAAQGAARRYQSGPKLRTRARALTLPSGISIRERARPLLERLHQLTHETAHLAIRADDQVLYLDKVNTDLPLRVDRPIGTLAPLHCTALGKVFLAFEGGPLPRRLTAYTVHTSVSENTLQASVERIVASGYATDDEEFAVGIRCVAAPLRDATGEVVAAIGLSGPAARIPSDKLDELGSLVTRVAQQFRL